MNSIFRIRETFFLPPPQTKTFQDFSLASCIKLKRLSAIILPVKSVKVAAPSSKLRFLV